MYSGSLCFWGTHMLDAFQVGNDVETEQLLCDDSTRNFASGHVMSFVQPLGRGCLSGFHLHRTIFHLLRDAFRFPCGQVFGYCVELKSCFHLLRDDVRFPCGEVATAKYR